VNVAQQDELLKQLLERVNENHDVALNTNADVKAIASTVTSLAKTVWGNGKPGLQEGQIRMEAALDTIKGQNDAQVKFCAAVQAKKSSKAEETLWYVIRVAAASLVVSGMAWAFWLLVAHQQIIGTVSAGAKP
jgi:hypothetical protein